MVRSSCALKKGHILRQAALILMLCFCPNIADSAQYGSNVYKPNVPKAKAATLRLIHEAIQVNFKVRQMILSGAGDPTIMARMLSQSYGIQQRAVSPIEGINEPGLLHVVGLINNVGKPYTMNAGGAVANGNSEQALEFLDQVQKAHQQMLILLR